MFFDAVICGAGAVGLSVARELSLLKLSVLVLEKNSLVGSETSSRSSEVIHAGIYYKNGSQKHVHCVRGRKLLYKYLAEKNIDFIKCGKLIVACSNEEISELHNIYQIGSNNDVEDLTFLSRSKLFSMEPELSCVEGFISKQTGVFDSHNFIKSLEHDILSNDGLVVCRHEVIDVIDEGKGFKISIAGMEEEPIFTSRFINCAGLHSIKVMQACRSINFVDSFYYKFAKGSYFSLSGPSPFQRLIYPIPEVGGLGIHSTIDFSGKTKFGPNVEWSDLNASDLDENYIVRTDYKDQFVTKIKKYWNNISADRLHPDYAGFRPKLYINGNLSDDFVIFFSTSDSGKSSVHLLGIESPGLTACLSLGLDIAQNIA